MRCRVNERMWIRFNLELKCFYGNSVDCFSESAFVACTPCNKPQLTGNKSES